MKISNQVFVVGLKLNTCNFSVDKKLCTFHFFTPLDLTVGQCKLGSGSGQAMEASIKPRLFAVCRA